MIPKIIHQTWKTETLPVPAAMPESWRAQNPGWEYRFWTDAMLADFVRETYPGLWPLYERAPKPVMRADIARYLLLHHFGGIYADIDTTCQAPLAPLEPETRVVLSQEPSEHWPPHATPRAMPFLLFNGTMASPAGHPFWLHVITTLKACRHAKEVLEATGPMMLTGAALSFPDQAGLALHSCHLFNIDTKDNAPSQDAEFGPLAPLRAATHHWAGTWLKKGRMDPLGALRDGLYKTAYTLTRGAYLAQASARALVDTATLDTPLPAYDPANLPRIALLIPLRNASRHIARCFELIDALDYPKDRLKITFVEGESKDDTVALLTGLIAPRKTLYRGIKLAHFTTGVTIPRRNRWRPQVQKKRRAAIAQVRNHLIREGLDSDDDFALWIDVDLCDYPADILHSLLKAGAKIATPDCTKTKGGPSYDMNAFLDVGSPRNARYYRFALGGIFQPPASYHWRRHLHDLRYLARVPLSAVGGTMLLVHASVHRAGITFPEIPYCDLLETEGFGKWAADMGVVPVGLPQLEIRHVDE